MRRLPERIELKSVEQIRLMRRAGLVVAEALDEMSRAAAPGVSTADLDEIAREVLRRAGATSSFLHYDIGAGPYPAVICASVNDRIVHGIPSAADKLADGDIVSLHWDWICDVVTEEQAARVEALEARQCGHLAAPAAPV